MIHQANIAPGGSNHLVSNERAVATPEGERKKNPKSAQKKILGWAWQVLEKIVVFLATGQGVRLHPPQFPRFC